LVGDQQALAGEEVEVCCCLVQREHLVEGAQLGVPETA
jgi:hypothetical protein